MAKKQTESLEYTPKSSWEVYGSGKHRKSMEALCKRYVDFLSRCKTERLVMDYVRERLAAIGVQEGIGENEAFVVTRGKSCFLARRGRQPLSAGFRLVGAHADSPRLDLKQHPLYQELQFSLAKTHYYGGIRKHQWLARPLALHGVVVKTDGTVVPVSVGEKPGEPVLTITDLLPHLAYKQVEKKLSEAFEAERLNILLAHEPQNPGKDEPKDSVRAALLKLLNDRYGIVEEDLYSAELQGVPAGPAVEVGLDASMIGGYGQDDRVCVFTALEAFLDEKEPEHTQVVLFWDKEEIGSEGSTGAQSRFFEYCLEDLLAAWEPKARLSHVLMAGKALSADVNAAVDPDHQDVHEKLNACYMGYGPCFNKFTGHRGKVGANDAHPEFVAELRGLLNGAGIPWQMAELGKVDLGGGGTVAKFLAVYGMDIIDIGPAVLSMHSPFEIAGKADIYATRLAFGEFLKR